MAAREVQMVRNSKVAVGKTAVTPVVPKIAATSATISTAHRHGVVSIANVSRVRPKVGGSNASALSVGQKAVDLSVSDPKTRATVNLHARDLPVRHEAMALIVTVSPARPKIFASMAPVGHALHPIRD
jgi:hypothetical protein